MEKAIKILNRYIALANAQEEGTDEADMVLWTGLCALFQRCVELRVSEESGPEKTAMELSYELVETFKEVGLGQSSPVN